MTVFKAKRNAIGILEDEGLIKSIDDNIKPHEYVKLSISNGVSLYIFKIPSNDYRIKKSVTRFSNNVSELIGYNDYKDLYMCASYDIIDRSHFYNDFDCVNPYDKTIDDYIDNTDFKLILMDNILHYSIKLSNRVKKVLSDILNKNVKLIQTNDCYCIEINDYKTITMPDSTLCIPVSGVDLYVDALESIVNTIIKHYLKYYFKNFQTHA